AVAERALALERSRNRAARDGPRGRRCRVMVDKEMGRAGGSLQARSDDQLSGSISSSNNPSATDTQAQLINTIKAHIAKGEQAAKKSEQHFISAGQLLKELKG